MCVKGKHSWLFGAWLTIASSFAAFAADTAAPEAGRGVFRVRDYGAVGDGRTLDTAAINQAIKDCSKAGGGEVLFTAGRYLSGTVNLHSHVSLRLETNARLLGTTNLDHYAYPEVPVFMPEARWGKWHRALVLGQDVEDVTICGGGVIDGNRVVDPAGEEHVRGPHTVLLVNCRQFTLRDLSIVDSSNYAVFFQVSDDVEIRNTKIVGGWDGVHFRGAPERWCRNVKIIGCQFSTGDDSIAGRYWDNTIIANCIVNSSCNGIRLIGPATHLIVDHCLFYGPGEQPHRTSARTNMLSGVILQPGAWDRAEGLLDDVFISQNTMRNVASPVTIWAKPGNPVGRVAVSGLTAEGVYRSAFSVESWSNLPITNIVFRDIHAEFAGGGTAAQGRQTVSSPGVDARPLPAWGFYARNVENLLLEDVRLSLTKEDLRPVIRAESVRRLEVDGVRYTPVEGVDHALSTTNVSNIRLHDSNLR